MAPTPAVATHRSPPLARDVAGFRNTLGPIDTIPAHYNALYTSPAPGAVAGIVLGSVLGFVLLLGLVYTCLTFGPHTTTIESSEYTAPSGVSAGRHRSRSASRHRSRSSRHRSRRRSTRYASPVRVAETLEVRTSARPHSRHIVVEPGVRRSASRVTASMPMAPPPPRVVVDDDDDDLSSREDEVIVLEENSPPRRSRSRRDSEVRRSSVYRERRERR